MLPEQNLTTGTDSYVTNRVPEPSNTAPLASYYGVPEQPQPLKRENIIRPISIRQLSHGYIVEVGCRTIAIENASTLIAKFSEYILNPNATEQKHMEGKLF